MSVELQPIDPKTFRTVLGHYPTGVCVITASETDGAPLGLVVGTFNSVSLQPPLVGFFPDRRSTTWPRIQRIGKYCVNVLAADQQDICRRFASSGDRKYDGLTFRRSPNGSPMLDGIVAWIDCTVEAVHEAGDHLVVLGRVTDLGADAAMRPLLFFQGTLGALANS